MLLTPTKLMPFSTVRLVAHRPDGKFNGTGFFFNFEHGDLPFPAIVTNRHVLEGAHLVEYTLREIDPAAPLKVIGNNFIQQNNAEGLIVLHPDPDIDLAILPIGHALYELEEERGRHPVIAEITSNHFADKNDPMWDETLLPVQMIGYPNGLFDEVNNRPIVRSGHIATSFPMDFNGKPEFVVDMACFPGSSGSPVFSFHEGVVEREGKKAIGYRFGLLGVLYAGPLISQNGQIIRENIPSTTEQVYVRNMMHLGYCIRAEKILEFVPVIQERFSITE